MGSASLAAARPPARPPARTVTTIPLQPGGPRGKNLPYFSVDEFAVRVSDKLWYLQHNYVGDTIVYPMTANR